MTSEDHRICLQNAMWTLAMSLSSQSENMREQLFTETHQLLDKQDVGGSEINVVHLEQVRARNLIVFPSFFVAAIGRFSPVSNGFCGSSNC